MIKNWSVIIICALAVISLILFMYISYLNNDRELEKAKLETDQAKQALEVSTAYTEQVKKELADTLFKANEASEKSKERIKWLEGSFNQVKDKLEQAIADKTELEQQIANIPVTPPADMPTELIVKDAASLYPSNDFSAAEATANRDARDLFQMMVLEIKERRNLSLANDGIIRDQQDQILRMGEINGELSLQLKSANNIKIALENINEALEIENKQYVKVNESLETQLEIYKKKQRFQWVQKPAVAVALIGGFVLGRAVIK